MISQCFNISLSMLNNIIDTLDYEYAQEYELFRVCMKQRDTVRVTNNY